MTMYDHDNKLHLYWIALDQMDFWSEEISLSYERTIHFDSTNRVRFAVAIGQFQSAQERALELDAILKEAN